MTKETDLWETPKDLYEELDKEFKFDIDLCADENNSKNFNYMDDYLTNSLGYRSEAILQPGEHWTDYYVNAFMNPPYSNPKEFIRKAYYESQNSDTVIVMLLKCDPSTSWWAIFWDYKSNKPKPGVEVRFLPKRLKFERRGIPGGSANFPSAIVILDRSLNND